ncbi:MAG: SLC13 family permease [Woeseiaceae bacterium]|nr:SLC13 family permease [Woeseiaceae bacterium]
MPELPNNHIAFVLALIVLALVLFATERIRLENAALLVLVCLLVTFSALPFEPAGGPAFEAAELFRGFGNEALVAVCALMILGMGIQVTRALQPLVVFVSRHWSDHPALMLLALLAAAAVLSAFLNNTPIVVILIPALIALARKQRMAPSRILMPMGLATIVGGTATTIGTSTNLLVVTLARENAGTHFEMFDFAGYIVIAGSLGILYLWLIAPRIVPERQTDSDEVRREFVAVLRVHSESNLVGSTVADFLNAVGHSLDVDHIEHERGRFRAPLPTVTLEADDYLFVRGDRDALKEAENVLQAPLTDIESAEHRDPSMEPKLAEILVTRGSDLHGRSLNEADFHARFGVTAVALHRASPDRPRVYRTLDRLQLRVGDILLCQGTDEQLERVASDTPLLLLHEARDLPITNRSMTALAIVAGVVLVAAFGLLPIAISALAGVGLMLGTGCLSWRQLGEALSARVILIIVVSLALGNALMVTGGDDYLASVFNLLLRNLDPSTVVMTVMLFSAVLTNVVTNNAAAVITLPIAVQIANQLGIDVEPLILAVLFGANLSYVTPIGYHDNLLIYSAGGYRFFDFVRVGAPLMLIMWLTLSWLLKARYGLA